MGPRPGELGFKTLKRGGVFKKGNFWIGGDFFWEKRGPLKGPWGAPKKGALERVYFQKKGGPPFNTQERLKRPPGKILKNGGPKKLSHTQGDQHPGGIWETEKRAPLETKKSQPPKGAPPGVKGGPRR